MFPNIREREITDRLHNIIAYRNIRKLKILLEEPVDLNKKNDKGYPPLVLACEQEHNDEMLEILMKRQDIDATLTNNEGFNALHVLSVRGKLVWITRLLEMFPNLSIDATTEKGNTALMLAAQMNHSDVIQYLYEKGSNVNYRNKYLFTALHFAATNGYEETTQKLIDLGATVNVRDSYDLTPLMKSSTWGFYETCKILIKHGAIVNMTYKWSQTALTQSVRRQHVDVVRLLLENRANPNLSTLRDTGFSRPLVYSCLNNNVEMTKLLIEYGADVNFPHTYSLPLFACATKGNKECLEELLKKGAKINGRNDRGKTAADVAKDAGHYDIVKILENN